MSECENLDGRCGGTWCNCDDVRRRAKSSFAAPHSSALGTTFIAEKSDTKFELTEAEKQHLDDLLAWQERSAKSLIRLGGTGEAPNAALCDPAHGDAGKPETL